MKDKLQNDMKDAMRAKDKVRLQTIRGLISAMQYERIQKNVEELAENDCLAVVKRELKKRTESLEFAEKSGRQETIDTIKSEIAVLEGYLPTQLSEAELEKIINDLKAADAGLNMGGAMKALKASYAGQYDGKLASQIAKKLLG